MAPREDTWVLRRPVTLRELLEVEGIPVDDFLAQEITNAERITREWRAGDTVTLQFSVPLVTV